MSNIDQLLIGKIVGALFLAMLVHEGSHAFMAKLYKRKIHFKLAFGKLFGVIPIPRGIWKMPMDLSSKAQYHIAIAGFAGEFILGLVLLALPHTRIIFAPYYMGVAFAHLVLYRFYAGEDSDFTWISKKKRAQ